MNGWNDVQQEAVKDAGKSFTSLVRDYAEAGHSMTETALLLGYRSPTHFFRMCNRYGWRDWFPKDGRSRGDLQCRETRRGVDTPALAAARAKRNYEARLYRGTWDTIAGHARRAGVPVKTAYNRLCRRPKDYEYAFHKGSHVRSPDNKNHYWRKNSEL